MSNKILDWTKAGVLPIAGLLVMVSAKAQVSAYAYVATSSGISSFTIDGSSGALTPIAGSPFVCGAVGQPDSLAVDPAGHFVYGTYGGQDSVSACAIDPTSGALITAPGSPFSLSSGAHPVSVTVDPAGRFVYVANRDANNISAFTIDVTSGALAPVPGSPFGTGSSPNSVVVEPSGHFLYVALGSSDVTSGNGITAFRINSATGALNPVSGSPFPAGTRPVSVAADPQARFLYAADPPGQGVWGFRLSLISGVLTPVLGAPFSTHTDRRDSFPNSVSVDPSGQFVFVASQALGFDTGDLFAYAIDGSTGALNPAPGSPFATARDPMSVAVDPSGHFVYLVRSRLGASITGLRIDPATGALTAVSGVDLGLVEAGAIVITGAKM